MNNNIVLSKLLQRATSNKTPVSKQTFSPSILYQLINDPFFVWCNFHAPKFEMIEEVDRYGDIKMQRGQEYEEAWVKKNYPDTVKIEEKWGLNALKQTLELMLKGTRVIYQPNLWLLSEEMYGKGDVFIRNDTAPSDLGDYHYRVIEIKRSRELKDYHSLQAVCYNKMLEVVQGYAAKEVTVVLAEGQENVAYDKEIVDKFNHYFNLWKQIRNGKNNPKPSELDSTQSPWRVYANKIITQTMDLTLIPGVGPATKANYQTKFGIMSIKDLYSWNEKELTEKLGTEIYYYVQAYHQNQPILKSGVKLHIPRDKRNFYFDFETCDGLNPDVPPHAYMIGVCDNNGKYTCFHAKGAMDEAKIFGDFLEYLGNLNDIHLYHWSDYEVGVIEPLIEKYPKLASELKKLLKACVDLKDVIKAQVYMPVPTYSIKAVAPALGFQWRQKDVGAFESMVLYWEFLADGDKKKIQKVIDYNEDDCQAMLYVDRHLSKLFSEVNQ